MGATKGDTRVQSIVQCELGKLLLACSVYVGGWLREKGTEPRPQTVVFALHFQASSVDVLRTQ